MSIKVEHLAEGGFNPECVKFWIYGESGAGKTYFAATWEDAVILKVDKGIASITWPINIIDIKEWYDLFEAYKYLASGKHPFKTIVLDSLNEAQKMAMRYTLETFTHIKRSYDSMPSESDWGKMLFDFDVMVRKFKDLPYNVVVTSLNMPKTFATDMVAPMLDGKKTVRNLVPQFDIVGYIYKEEGKKRIIAFDIPEFLTKDRSAVLPARMENPTHASLKRLWTQERTVQVPELISFVPDISVEYEAE